MGRLKERTTRGLADARPKRRPSGRAHASVPALLLCAAACGGDPPPGTADAGPTPGDAAGIGPCALTTAGAACALACIEAVDATRRPLYLAYERCLFCGPCRAPCSSDAYCAALGGEPDADGGAAGYTTCAACQDADDGAPRNECDAERDACFSDPACVAIAACVYTG